MLDLALVVVFSLHLLAVNVATGAPFICLWLQWRETARNDALAGQLGRHLARLTLWLMLVGVGLGFAALGLVSWIFPSYVDTLLRVPGRGVWLGVPERLWSALAEIGIFGLSIWAYAAIWQWMRERGAWHRFWHAMLGLFGAVNIFYHLPPLFAVVAVIGERPELIESPVRFWQLMLEPEVVARTLHSWLAALAVSGIAVIACAESMARRGESESARRVAVWGAWISLVPTVLQLGAGTFLLFQLPAASQQRMLGGDGFTVALFGVSLLASLGLMHHLAAIVMGDCGIPALRRSIILMVTVVLLMVGVRHLARRSAIGQSASTVETTASPVDDRS